MICMSYKQINQAIQKPPSRGEFPKVNQGEARRQWSALADTNALCEMAWCAPITCTFPCHLNDFAYKPPQ
jgi:hypothetical protein